MPKPPPDQPDARSPLWGGPLAALLIGIGLAVYLVAFFGQPLFSGQRAVSRLDYLGFTLLRPDDLVRQWFTGASWTSLGQRMLILAVAAAILCVALAAGWACLRALRVDRAVSKLEMTLFSLGVGLNLVSLATLILGLAGWLRLEAFGAVALVACLAAAVIYRRAGCASGTAPIAPPVDDTADSSAAWPTDRRWLWLIVPFSAAIVLAAMLPPIDFDVREYHLQAPKEFFLAGQITFLPHNVYANMPLGAEMLSLPAMVLLDDWWTGALVGKTLIGLFAPLAALLLYAAGCRLASPAAGIVAAIVYISIPWITLVSGGGLIEGAFAFYLFAAFYAALIWAGQSRQPSTTACDSGATAGLSSSAHSGEDTAGRASSGTHATPPPNRPTPCCTTTIGTRFGLLATSGFLAGAAVSTKYPGVLYAALPLAVYVVYQAVASRAAREPGTTAASWIAAPAAVFVLATACGCAPWFVKNAALTGNPTYPLLYGVFDGQTRTPQKDDQWLRAHRPPNFAPGDLARRAWDATVAGQWLSPLVVPLAVLALVPRRGRRLAWLVAGYLAFVFAAWWLLTHRIDRFLVPALPLAALLAGLGAAWSAHAWWRRTLMALLAVGLVFDFMLDTGGPVADNRYLADLNALRVDPVRVDAWTRYFNEHADDVDGLLLVGGAQPFDFEVPTTYNTVFDSSIFEQLAGDRSPEEVRRALAERGISHILVDWSEIDRYRSPGNYGITDFLQPSLFDELVAAGVLEALPPPEDTADQAFRVLPARSSS